MKQSLTPNFITKDFPKDEESYNARILVRAGFVQKVMAGAYAYLPLGLLVLRRIEGIIRKHMDKLGREIIMPQLHPKDSWETTGRWDSLDVLFKVISNDKKEYALGPTHEEIVVPIAQKAIFSYRDLPMALYQIQTKFRDEPRAKSGLLRGREFIMKDLYSFHTDQDDLKAYYQRVKEVYHDMFKEMGLDTKLVAASGGTFSKFSHEFQVLTETGEDTIVICPSCGFAQNKEINDAKEGDICPECGKKIEIKKASEVGNIFELNRKYSDPFNLTYKDNNGVEQPVYMGCYGVGVSRLMGVVAELFHDNKGLIWPASIAPFDVHLLELFGSDEKENKEVTKQAEKVYNALQENNISVLFDDRRESSPGEKFSEADLVGIPVRLVVSKKTGDKAEYKRRGEEKASLMSVEEIIKMITTS